MSRKSKINRERFYKYVVPVIELLEKMDIFYWLDFGTLLGAVRIRSIIDCDFDFDISIWDVDREKLIIAKEILEKNGCKVVFQKNLPWFEDLMQIYIPRENLATDERGKIKEGIDHIDIHVYTKINDKACIRQLNAPSKSKPLGVIIYKLFRMINKLDPMYSVNRRLGIGKKSKAILFLVDILPIGLKQFISRVIWQIYLQTGETEWFIVPLKYLSKFTKISVYGIDFNIPSEYEKYLGYWYSKNWRAPDSSWSNKYLGGIFVKKIRNSPISHLTVQPVHNIDKYLWEE